MSKRIWIGVLAIVVVALFTGTHATAAATVVPVQQDDCYGDWYAKTGTDSGAGGRRVNYLGLFRNDDTASDHFKSGVLEGDEIQNGAEAKRWDVPGSCAELGNLHLHVDYAAGLFEDQWQVELITLKVTRDKGTTNYIKCFSYYGPKWIRGGGGYYEWHSITDSC